MYDSVVRDSGLGVLGRYITGILQCKLYLHAYKRCFLLSIHYLAAIRDFL